MATPQQLLAQAGRPARQDLSGAANGTIQGAHGGTQPLGAAAMRRLAGAPGQTPGMVPPMPTGTPPNQGGPTSSAPYEPRYTPPGGMRNEPLTPPPGGPLPAGGPHSLGGQNVQPVVDVYTPGGMQAPGDQLQSMIAQEQPQPGLGGANQAGGGPSTFNLPGFKPALQAATAGPGGQSNDLNAMRQALGAGSMMNNIAKDPDPSVSPFGQAPPAYPVSTYSLNAYRGAVSPALGQVPPRGVAGVGGMSPGAAGGVKQPGQGSAGTPWAPGGFQLRGFKPKGPGTGVIGAPQVPVGDPGKQPFRRQTAPRPENKMGQL